MVTVGANVIGIPVPTTCPFADHVTSNKFWEAAIIATVVGLPGQITGLLTSAWGTVPEVDNVTFVSTE